MARNTKTAQLQIRVTPAQKAAIGRAARASGLDMSSYVLRQLLPQAAERFADRFRREVDADAVGRDLTGAL